MLFISSHGDIPISHLRSWNNRKTKSCRPLNTRSGFPPLVYFISELLQMPSFPLISNSCHLYDYFSASSLFPCTFLPFQSCIFSPSVGFMILLSYFHSAPTFFHNFYLFWQLATHCLRKYFPKDCSSPPCQRKHFRGLKNYYLIRKEDMTATFCYASKNSQKTEMSIQIIAVCHIWIKLSNIK